MNLHFRTYGTGQPLVILHGLFGTSDNWQTLGKAFAEKFTVYLVDLRNHGHSPHSPEMDYWLMADDVKNLFDAEGISNAILMGHSMGGKTAMFFAQLYPELLSKLIVVDMGAKKYPPHHQVIFDALSAVDLNLVKSRKEAEKIISSHFNDQGVIQFLLKNLYWVSEGQLAWRMNLPVLIEKIDSILEEVPQRVCEIPTLFIRGGKSNYILEEDWSTIQEIFPNSELKSIATAGHWVHAEAPKEFYGLVMDFIG